MLTVLITGANRGIGLALTQAYLARGEQVLAACRTPERAADLQSLRDEYGSRLMLLPLDVTDTGAIRTAVAQVRAQVEQIDILINNAAVNPPEEDQTLEYIDFTTMLDVLRINTAAPLIVAQHLAAMLPRGGRIINISSGMGSIGETRSGGYYGYSTSKAGLNMVSRLLANDLRARGIIVLALDPGWVRTDMGGTSAPLAPEESASGMMRIIDGLALQDSGRFMDYAGRMHVW